MTTDTRFDESTGRRCTAKVSLHRDLWRTKCWRLFPLLIAYFVFLTLLLPIKPDLMTGALPNPRRHRTLASVSTLNTKYADFFASRHSRHYVRCESFPPSQEPKACQDAHSSAVTYSSWSDFVSNSLLLFLLAPLVGRWSDVYGRQPFLVITFICASFPVMVLFFNLNFGLSMYFYFPAQAVNGALSSMALCMAYTADLLHPEHRAPTFGLLICSLSVGILVGPLGGGYLRPEIASIVALAGLTTCVAYTVLLIPESTTQESRSKAGESRRGEAMVFARPWHGFAILCRTGLFVKLTITVMITGVVSEGMYELVMQYLQIKLGFSAKDQSHMFVLAGICGMFSQLVLLRLLLRLTGKTGMLLTGLVASLIQQILMALASNKATALIGLCVGAIGNLSFPAVSSIKSLHVAESEQKAVLQGAMQGALQGARALAQGLGPLIFAGLFALFTKSWSPLPYYPGAPFVIGGALTFVGLIITATVNRSQADAGRSGSPSDGISEQLLHSEGAQQLEKASNPPLVVPQHSEGAAILLDQLPEIAVDVLPQLHLAFSAEEEQAGSTGENVASSSS